MKKIAHTIVVLISLGFLTGCAGLPNADDRRADAQRLITQHGWHSAQVAAADVSLFAAYNNVQAGKVLRVYIEGDGFAYITAYQASGDPTPLKPTLLSLALADPSPNIAYLARPCQYLRLENQACTVDDWTTGRFSPVQVKRMNAALDNLKTKFSLTSFELVGYSGGAALAANLAGMRNDVSLLITVAGNLDIAGFLAYHQSSPLSNVAEPLSLKNTLRTVPQRHLVSNDDKIIPPTLVQGYLHALDGTNAHIVIVDGPSHSDGWQPYWQNFIHEHDSGEIAKPQ